MSTVEDKVLQLFKELHIPQIKDKLLTVSQDLAKNDVLLNKNLELHYKDILTITQSVNNLYGKLQENDTHFRQLCFDDDKYQLGRLPDFQQKRRDSTSNTLISTTTTSSTVKMDDDNLLLLISQWSLATSKFIIAINSSSSIPTTQTDKLLAQFNKLVACDSVFKINDSGFKYYESVNSKLNAFLTALLQNVNIILLSHLQWIQIYNLINKNSSGILPWNMPQVKNLNILIMDKVIKLLLSPGLAMGNNNKLKLEVNNNETIQQFINSEQFNERILSHIKTKIMESLQQLKDILSEQESSDISTPDSHQSYEDGDLDALIKDSKFDSLGLISKKRQQIYNLVEPCIQMIQYLIDYQCDKNSIEDIRDQIISLLKQECLAKVDTNTTPKPVSENTDTANLISAFVDSYHKDNFINLIRSQVKRLETIST